MPSHLGKLYTRELLFVNVYDASIARAATQNEEDLAKISATVATAVDTMTRMHSTMMKTLTDSSVGIILITTKLQV